jgi:hypothetical protein
VAEAREFELLAGMERTASGVDTPLAREVA